MSRVIVSALLHSCLGIIVWYIIDLMQIKNLLEMLAVTFTALVFIVVVGDFLISIMDRKKLL